MKAAMSGLAVSSGGGCSRRFSCSMETPIPWLSRLEKSRCGATPAIWYAASDSGGADMDRAEEAVRERYSQGAKEREDALCCPVSYDAQYLKVLPQEILERDYGCGDPSRYVQ